jgi:hypothetical protein
MTVNDSVERQCRTTVWNAATCNASARIGLFAKEKTCTPPRGAAEPKRSPEASGPRRWTGLGWGFFDHTVEAEPSVY